MSEKTIREIINEYRNRVANTSELTPAEAAEIVAELSSLMGNVNDEILARDREYNEKLLLILNQEDMKVNKAMIMVKVTSEYLNLETAKNLGQVVIEMIRGLKYYIKAKGDEWNTSPNM